MTTRNNGQTSPSGNSPPAPIKSRATQRELLEQELLRGGAPSLSWLTGFVGKSAAMAMAACLEYARKLEEARQRNGTPNVAFIEGKLEQTERELRPILAGCDLAKLDRDSAAAWRRAVFAKIDDLRAKHDRDHRSSLERRRLHYLLKVAELKDASAFEKVEGAELSLARLEQFAPPHTALPEAAEAWLVLGVQRSGRGRQQTGRAVIARLRLRRSSTGTPQSWCFSDDASLVLDRAAFFDPDTSEPRGDWREDEFIAAGEPLFTTPEPDCEAMASDPQSEPGAGEAVAAAPTPAVDIDAASETAPGPNPAKASSWRDAWALARQRLLDLVRAPGLSDVGQALRLPGADRIVKAWLVDATEVRPSGFANTLRRLLDDGDKISSAARQALQAASAATPVDAGQGPASVSGPVGVQGPRSGEIVGTMDSRPQPGGTVRQAFPLDPTQRVAARCALALADQPGHAVHAVTGPPGSGKTAFLRAVLASRWVRAALDEAPGPPVVLATAATNKAVTNIIDAFASCVDERDNLIESRWLVGFPTYGWFLAANGKVQEYGHHMLLDLQLNTRGAASKAADVDVQTQQEHFLGCAGRALGLQSDALTVPSVAGELLRRLREHDDQARRSRDAVAGEVDRLRASWPVVRGAGARLRRLRTTVEEQARELAQLEIQRQLLASYIDKGQLLLGEQHALETGWRSLLLRWLRPGLYRSRRQQLDEAHAELRQQTADAASQGFEAWPARWFEAPARLEAWRAHGVAVASRTRQLQTDQETLQRQIAELDAARQSWRRTAAGLLRETHGSSGWWWLMAAVGHAWKGTSPPDTRAAAQRLELLHEEWLDLHVRVPSFHLAARYWEARWLMARENADAGEPMTMQQLSMLGVVTVATTHMLNILMGRHAELPLADLLVVDESGQCEPEVGLAMFGAARSALLVGDLAQLAPVSQLPRAVSTSLARQAGLRNEVEPHALPAGMSASGGSAMGMALLGATWNEATAQGWRPGVMLGFHYRCHPVIAQYCNELMYGGQMRMVRPNKSMPLPPMAWVDVKGVPTQPVGQRSWVNEAEAQEIADWLVREHPVLLALYAGKTLDQIVGVITPLRAQALLIEQVLRDKLAPALGEEGAETVQRMMTGSGTVHRLQGAERPVIAFSLVQTDAQSLFADRDGGNLMNVAVSRAQDCFVIFADRGVLRAGPLDPSVQTRRRSPVALLGAYLRQHGTRLYPRHLVLIEAAGKRQHIQQVLGAQVAVVQTNGAFEQSVLGADGTLQWRSSGEAPGQAREALRQAMASHAGLLDGLVVATDDDMAGELIGWRAAVLARGVMGDGQQVLRMRMQSLDPDTLQLAWQARGPHFDTALLGAALLREVLRHWDAQAFRQAFPEEPYVSLQERAAVALLAQERQEQPEPQYEVYLTLHDGQGTPVPAPAFVAAHAASVAEPLRMTIGQANALESHLQGWCTPARQLPAPDAQLTLRQLPGLYPPSTTMRVLGLASDELGLLPQDAHEVLQQLYLEGGGHG